MGENNLNNLITAILISLFIIIIAIVNSCESANNLDVSDFKFDGPLGSDGATITKIDKNLFKVTLNHAPNQSKWCNKLNFEITGNAKGNNLTLIVEGPPQYSLNEYFHSW